MSKRRRVSKTYWFNAIMLALAELESRVQLLAQFFGNTTMQIIVAILVIGNMIIREYTTQPIKRSGEL